MAFILNTKIRSILGSLVMAVVLLLTVLGGASAGNKAAQSQQVINEVSNLQNGLNYFYQDQNRFPTAVEFADSSIMAYYFDNFPPQEFPSSSCQSSLLYKRISDTNYQLDFCLPVSLGQYKTGWNVINKQE